VPVESFGVHCAGQLLWGFAIYALPIQQFNHRNKKPVYIFNPLIVLFKLTKLFVNF